MKTNKLKRRIVSMLTVLVMVFGMMPAMAFADSNVVKVSSAADLPTTLAAGVTYELTQDITLSSGQQIDTMAGVLDGKGHTITLADKPLANNVTGTIQNLGVKSSGTISVSGYSGTMAVTLSGTIQNCYSTVNVTTSGYDDIGGLVGTLSGGKIYNSYYAGTNSAMFADGLVAYATGGAIANSCYTAGWSAIGMGSSKVTQTNVQKTSDIYSVISTDVPATGFMWTLSGDGIPVLKEGIAENEVDRSALEAKIAEIESYEKDKYTVESWDTLQSELTDAKAVLANKEVTQAQVDAVLAELTAAANALEKKKPAETVAVPEDESKVVHITNQAQLEAIGAGDADKYYVLDNDISTDGWYMSFDDFNGVFDGQGHTITFNNDFTGLFKNTGSNGVIQNVHFKGSLKNGYGACGTEIKGAVINCYSEIAGDNAVGFAKRLNGGVISNCYSVGTAVNGAIIAEASDTYTGTLKNVYWQSDLKQPADLDTLTVQGSTGALSKATMTTMDFVDALNENKGENGTAWGQNSNGYPYFGENKEVESNENIKLEENVTEIAFSLHDDSETVVIESQKLTIDKNDVDGSDIAGTFSLPEYDLPVGATIEWGAQSDVSGFMIGSEKGNLRVENEGVVIVTATQKNADGTTRKLASVAVTVESFDIEAIKLYLASWDNEEKNWDDENAVELGEDTVVLQGSEDKKVIVKAKYANESIYRTIATSVCSISFQDENGVIKRMEGSSSFKFNEPGEATLNVVYNNDTDINASANIKSEYVAVNSVKPGIEGTVTIHGRNANSTDKAYLPIYADVVVNPSNASYAGDFTITSSDESIGEYVPSMVVGYVPYKAGTVTYTATVDDNGEIKTGTSEVQYVYKNPLTSVTAAESEYTLKTGEKVSAGLTFKGTTDEYTVTETGMIWTYDNEGIVKIVREDGDFVIEDGEKLYFLGSEYTIHGLAEGTVTVTGTPVDNTGGAEPITFTVTVGEGDLPVADIDEIISTGIGTATGILTDQIETGLEYGYEWNVITLFRAGKPIDETLLDQYYDSVVDTVKDWTGTEKPTTIERTALAMAVMGKDITNIGGVDLAEMIYNHDDSAHYKMTDGSNELAYGLLALDAADAQIPEDAAWTRETLVNEILKYQNSDEGFFGLTDNTTGSIDMTCICLQAIAPYGNDPEVAAAIEKGVAYLAEKIDGNYGYGDANATAQVLLTLSVLGIDVTDSDNGFGTPYSNIITRLDDYRTEDGFEYTLGGGTDLMATYQVMQSFDAYRKAHKENISYWDFSTAGAAYDDSADTGKDDDINKDEVTPANVYVTIADENGKLALAQEEITVTDVDKDGALTINDALYIAHEEFYEGGAAAGYSSEYGTYGLSMTKLWGYDNGYGYGYRVNDAYAWSLTDPVEEGDYVNAFVYTTSTYSDTYTWFDKKNVVTNAGSEFEITLYEAGYDAEWNPISLPAANATITIDGKETAFTTDENGKVTIKLDKEGSYVISAVSDTQTLVPPVCKVTVTEKSAAGTGDAGEGTPADKVTQTGDDFNIVFFVIIALAALAIAVVVRRRNYNN